MDMRLAKTTVLAVLLSIVALLVACGAEETPEEAEKVEQEREKAVEGYEEARERFGKMTDLNIEQDSATGCKYVVNNQYRQGGMTVLLKADGTPDCGQ